MPFMYHHKQSNTLIIDWLTHHNEKPCYISLPYLDIDNKQEVGIIPLSPSIDPYRLVNDTCKQLGIQKIILLNLFGCLGPTCSRRIIHKLRNITNDNYLIYLGGVVEVVCGELFNDFSTSGISTLTVLEKLDNLKISKNTGFVPIDCTNSDSQKLGKILVSMLKTFGIEDTIELSFPKQKNLNKYKWDTEWIVKVNSNSTQDSLLDIIAERIQSLKCNNISITGNIFNSTVWADKNAFIAWLSSLNQQNQAIGVTISLPSHYLDKDFLCELHQLNVNKCELQLSPSSLLPQNRELICKIADTCIENNITKMLTGSLVTEKALWNDVRNMWNMCDRIGADFIEMLGIIPIDGQNGWCKELCRRLSQSPSLLVEYSKTTKRVKLAKCFPKLCGSLHSSISAFYRAKMEQARNWILGEISYYGSLGLEKDNIEKAGKEVAAELVDISENLSRMRNQHKGEKHSSTNLISKHQRSDVAIVVVAKNKQSHLHLCLHSIYLNTNRSYDLFVIDCGNIQSSCKDIPCQGQLNYIRPPLQRLKSFATALGLTKAWEYDYILVLDSNACALKANWLNEMIEELNVDPKIGATGLKYKQLDYKNKDDKSAAYLYQFVSSPRWWKELGYDPSGTKDNFIRQLTIEGSSCFAELTGWVQLYRGNILHHIGLPIVNDRILKHHHWDSELSMRVIGCGYQIKSSTTAKTKLKYFREKYYSQIPEVSYYSKDVENTYKWLIDNGYEQLSQFLEYNPHEGSIAFPSYYDWM